MLLRRFYDTRLAQASYLVGCQRTGEALIIDPSRDIEPYLAAVKAEGMRLTHITETHIHADFLSGARELAAVSKAQLFLSDEGGRDWRYAFAAESGAVLVKDGSTFKVGNIRIDVLHTPGHTPEHISFMITDGAATDRPMGAFSGDFIFVGDVGRPDLLEKAAGIKGTMESGARQLYASLQRFKQFPDYLQLWPAHGAGSACGKALGAVPSSTLGYERFANWGLTAPSEDAFVQLVLEGQPEPPAYFAQMKRLNRDGPPPRPTGRPGRVADGMLRSLVAGGSWLVDTRKTAEFAAGHVRGTLNIPFGNSFPTYAGTLLPFDQPIHLIVAEAQLDDALTSLYSIGLDQVAGWFAPAAVAGAGELDGTTQVAPQDAAARLAAGAAVVLDVRKRSEWDEGHLAGAIHVPLGDVPGAVSSLPTGTTIILQCEAGTRSAIAASVLRARGRHDIANLTGGINAWKDAGLPVEREAGVAAGAGGS
jgi:hydroxyacylglutathione hydrolase